MVIDEYRCFRHSQCAAFELNFYEMDIDANGYVLTFAHYSPDEHGVSLSLSLCSGVLSCVCFNGELERVQVL